MRANRKTRAALSVAAFLALGGVYAAAQTVPVTTIAATGMAAPGTTGASFGTIPTSGSFPTIAIGNDGKVTFLATGLTGGDAIARSATEIGNNEAVYQYDPVTNALSLVLRRGDLIPGSADTFFGQPSTGSGVTANLVTSITAGAGGKIGLLAFTYDALSPSPSTDTRIYYGTPGSLTQVAREGGTAPGLTSQVYQSIASAGQGMSYHLTTNNDTLYFSSNMATVAAPTIDIGDAVYRYDSTNGVQLFLNTKHVASATPGTSIPLPGGGTGELGTSGVNTLTARPVSSDGTVLTRGSLATGGAITTSNDEVLFLTNSAGTRTVIAREGDATPDLVGVNYGTIAFYRHNIVNNGATPTSANIYTYRIALAGAGVNTADNNSRNVQALYATDVNGGNLKLLAREGDVVPSYPVGGYPVVTPGPSAYNVPASFDGTMEFSANFEYPRMSESGWVVFGAQLRYSTPVATETTANPVGGSSSTAYKGLYLGRISTDGSKELREVAMDRDSSRVSGARLGILRGNDSDAISHWIDPGQGSSLTYTINSGGKVLFYAGLGEATTSTSSSAVIEGLFIYDPDLDRITKVAGIGDVISVNGSAKTLTGLNGLGTDNAGGSNDGYRSAFTDDGKIVFRGAYSGGDGLFMVNYADLLPPLVAIWKSDEDGDWTNVAKWQSAVPNGIGHEVNFAGAITTPRTVTLDADHKVGSAYFENANSYTIAGPGKLILDNASASARLGVIAGSHTIAAPVELLDDVDVIVDSATDVLTVSGVVSGDKGINKGGPGTLALSAANTFTGPVRAAFGTIEVNGSGSLGNGSATNTLVLDGGIIKYNASATEPRAINVTTATTTTRFAGGIDTGANEVTLTGAMSDPASSGFFNKHGTGKLIMAGTGGPSGVNIRAGTLEIVNAQTWGSATTTVSDGASLVIPSGKSLTTGGALTVASGGSLELPAGGSLTMTGTLTLSSGTSTVLNGSATIGGTMLASWGSGGASILTINAPTTVGALTVGASSPAPPADRSNDTKVTINAPVTATGTGGNNIYHTLDINSGGSLTTSGNIWITTTSIVTTAGAISTTRRLELDNGITVEPGGSLAAGSLYIGSAAGVTLNVNLPVVGTNSGVTDMRGEVSASGTFAIAPGVTLSANNQFKFGQGTVTGTNNGTIDVGSILVGESSDSANIINFIINGSVVASPKTVPGTTPINTTGEYRMAAASSNSSSVTPVAPQLKTEINSGGALTSTALNFTTRTTSTSTSGLPLTAVLTFDAKVGSTITTGPILIQADERLAGKNTATHNLTFAGTATANSIRYQSALNSVAQREPNAGIVNITIPGTLNLRASTAGGATSLLRKVPDFAATGKLDLNDNDLVINYVPSGGDIDPGPALWAAVASGRNATPSGPTWDGVGIGSSAAKNNALKNTGLAMGTASAVLGLSGATTATWSGVTVDATSYLVKYTYNGDANFDGKVNIDDYFKIDTNYASALANPVYTDGNFDYDTDIDADDYFLIDAAFVSQGGPLSGGSAAPMPVAVPEPATLGLLTSAGLLLSRRRRRS